MHLLFIAPKMVEDESGLIKAHGLSLLVAGVFLAGEMAGTGVLALPHAMVGTGRTTTNTSRMP
jgi:hypothetical protein